MERAFGGAPALAWHEPPHDNPPSCRRDRGWPRRPTRGSLVPLGSEPMRLVNLVLLLASLTVLVAAPRAQADSTTGGDKKKGGGPAFLQFPTLTASVTRPAGRRGVLTVEVGLDVADERLRERAAASTPRLRDAFVRYLTAYAVTVPLSGPPNPDLIAVGLQRSADQVLGKPGARLLLGTVMIN